MDNGRNNTTDPVQTEIRRLTELHRAAYYGWIRHVVTLASGSLTLLVGLQKHYIPVDAHRLYLLKYCWGGLTLSILLGIVALYGEAQSPLIGLNEIESNEYLYRVGHGHRSTAFLPKEYEIAQRLLSWTFSGSLTCLFLFAVLNL